MNTEILEQKKMDTVKELANANMKISEAKNALFKLQEEETEYLEQREKKALSKIDNMLVESKDLLSKVYENYEETHKFCREVVKYSEFLSESHEKFSGLLEIFDKKNKEWDKKVEKQQKEFDKLKEIISIEKTFIKNEKTNIEKAQIRLRDERKKLDSDRGTVERMIIRLKEGRI